MSTIDKIYDLVNTKLKEVGSEFLLTRLISDPSESNILVLKAEVINLMKQDENFKQELSKLIIENTPSILDGAIIEGDLELGNIEIKGDTSRQSFGKGLVVKGKASFGDISIKNTP